MKKYMENYIVNKFDMTKIYLTKLATCSNKGDGPLC